MTAPVKLTDFEQSLIKALPQGNVRDNLSNQGLPHRRVEDWKWSDLKSATSQLMSEVQELPVKASLDCVDTDSPSAPDSVMPSLAQALGPTYSYRLGDDDSLELDVASHGQGSIEIEVAEGCSAQLVERYQLSGGHLTNLSVVIRLGKNARLDRVVTQDGDETSVFVLTSAVSLSPSAHYSQTILGFGGKLVRMETRIEHPGDDARVELGCSYLLEEGRHFDHTSIVHHTGEGGVTRQTCKGAAANKATGVFQGKFHVERYAQKTDADMQHRGLLLSDGATINAKPELEIYADDVVCAHGNAIGAIDEDALFYMRQRGLSETRARALLTESFLAEPLEAISNDVVRETMLESLHERLGALI